MTFSLFGQMRGNVLRRFLMSLAIVTLILNSLMILINIISFLDLKVPLSRGSLTIDSQINPIDRHQYFYFTSADPDHTRCSIVFSQI